MPGAALLIERVENLLLIGVGAQTDRARQGVALGIAFLRFQKEAIAIVGLELPFVPVLIERRLELRQDRTVVYRGKTDVPLTAVEERTLGEIR